MSQLDHLGRPVLDPGTLDEIAKVVTDMTGFMTPEGELRTIFEGQETLLREVHEFGGVLGETDIREQVAEEIADVLVGRRWPNGLDGEAYRSSFNTDLEAAALKRGWLPA